MSNVIIRKFHDAKTVEAELRDMRRAAKKILASKSAARRFLASTGMYTLKGELKPQFR